MTTFSYKWSHLPTGKSAISQGEFLNVATFEAQLAEWNRVAKLGGGKPHWHYEPIDLDEVLAKVERTDLEGFAERKRNDYTASVVARMEEYMLREIAAVQKKFPKRAISIMDNQFSTNVYVDYDIVYDYEVRAPLLESLFSVLSWYVKFSEEYRVEIGALTVAPEGTETKWIHERIEYVSKVDRQRRESLTFGL